MAFVDGTLRVNHAIWFDERRGMVWGGSAEALVIVRNVAHRLMVGARI